MSELTNIEARLKIAIKQSGQSRYQREEPDSESIRGLAEARDELRRIVESQAENHRAWDLLSLAEECLLAFRSAKRCLQTKCDLLDKVSKKDRKRLALLEVAIQEAENESERDDPDSIPNQREHGLDW